MCKLSGARAGRPYGNDPSSRRTTFATSQTKAKLEQDIRIDATPRELGLRPCSADTPAASSTEGDQACSTISSSLSGALVADSSFVSASDG